ncbi:MAG: hypothetical protein PHF72_05190, partial [Gammaproteobacteria bacterium]|nr:hypothetical protein [Gammaproteobacteria bacterium]
QYSTAVGRALRQLLSSSRSTHNRISRYMISASGPLLRKYHLEGTKDTKKRHNKQITADLR